ncbi:MAG: DedA family protein [Patescibacteria group bacterium]
MDILLHSGTFSTVIQWVLGHGYWVIFLGMLIEGPIVTTAAAFAITLGYFNFTAILLLAILSDLVADVAYYLIGYWGRITVVDWFGRKIGLSHERLERISDLVKKNPWRTLLVLKITPIIPTTGLMVVGTTKMNLRKYIIICTIIIFPRAIFFTLLGYYFGNAYEQIGPYITNGSYLLVAIIVAVILINYLFRKYSARLGQSVEKI